MLHRHGLRPPEGMDALFPLMGRRGRSSYEAKIEIGHKLGPLNNCCRHRNIFLHNVYRIFMQTIRWRLNGRSPGPLPESAS
jgi:hypothetical protein